MPSPKFHSRSLTELIALREDTQPVDPAVHTGAAEFGEELMTLSYSDIAKSVDRLAHHYSSLQLPHPCPPDETPPEQVIAVLTSTAVDESLLEIALAKLGLTSLLLSINNSVAAVVHLCRQTRSSHLIYGPKYEVTARETKQILAQEGYELEIVAERRFPLWGGDGIAQAKVPPYAARLSPDLESKRTCVILHSSGSTGFPKPVFITHYGLIANIAMSIPETGFSALPLFHGFGHFSIFRCIYNGKAFTLMPPNLPLTSANICKVIRSSPTRPVQHFAVPYVLKLLAETKEGTETLASFEAVSFAGASVPDDLGDRLVAAGVPLISVYGTTETGGLLTSRRDCTTDKGWNWLRAEGSIAKYLELDPQGSDTYEIIVHDGWPAKIMSNRADGAYCTKDLVLRHPTNKTWFKYIGRLDDTLTQTLGEKTNPVPVELTIRGNSPLVQECIVFGDARPQVGALILPSEQGEELSKDKKAFIDAIWPVIAEANAAAPTHSRILPEMVDVLPYGTEIPVATKMSILRPACYKKFAPLINAIYDRFEQVTTGQPKRIITTQSEMETFLTETVITALGEKAGSGLTPTTDLFSYGVDSLQAIRVRNVIGKSLDLGTTSLGQNIVYEHPSIKQLAEDLLALGSGGLADTAAEQAHATMLAMVERWSVQILPIDSPSTEMRHANGHTREVVVLTGATGSLGAHILHQLVNRPDVSRVICLSRASDHQESLKRVRKSLAERELSLSTEAQTKIISFAADVNRPDLGLAPEQFEMLRLQSTAVIHNAWPVNFVLSIDSFDAHIGGVINLLNLALSSPRGIKPAFFFSSSVSTRQGRPDPVVDEGFSDEPGTAGGMGYGGSKWVVEKLCERAGKAGARVGVLRIGQLVGDTQHGVWNETEAWPLVFKSANSTGSLPSLNEKLSWLPVDQAGQAISEIVLSTLSSSDVFAPHAQVYHVLNARLGRWEDVLRGLKQGGLSFETVERKAWLEKLAGSDQDVVKNPTIKLLSFYQNRLGKDEERPHTEFSVKKAAEMSPTLAQCKAVDAELVALWTRHWMKTGFLE